MAWIPALRRRLRAAAIVAAFALALGLTLASQAPRPDLVFLLQVAACAGALWMLYAEWDEVRAQLWVGRQALAERTLKEPGRWERWPGGWWPLFFTFGASFAGVVLAVELPGLPREPAVVYLVLLAFAVPWTLAAYLLITLGLAGLSLLRVRLALRAILPEARPALQPVAPWSVALAALLLLTFGAVGRPGAGAALAVQGGWVALELLGAETTEVLVELGPDDTLDDPLVVLALAPFADEAAFSGLDLPADSGLGRTRVVKVPIPLAESYMALLDADDEDFAHIELNAAITIEASGPARPCVPSRSIWTFDPYAGSQPELGVLFDAPTLHFLAGRTPAKPTLVAVIDSGIEADHEDLVEAMSGEISDAGLDHGTWVAGLVGAVGANQRGIVTGNVHGRYVRMRSYPIFQREAQADDVARAILQATHDGAHVINLSFGAVGPPPVAVLTAVQFAQARDVLIVASAGNVTRHPSTQASDQWPANIPGVLVVGARDRQGAPLSSSKRLDGVHYGAWAPGDGLCTTHREGAYVSVSGTSFAAGLVSGYAAVLLALRPDWSAAQVRDLLVDTLR